MTAQKNLKHASRACRVMGYSRGRILREARQA